MEAESATEIWRVMLEKLRQGIDDDTMVISFKPARPHLVRNTLVLDVPNAFVQERLESRLDVIRAALPSGCDQVKVLVGFKPAATTESRDKAKPATSQRARAKPSREITTSEQPEGFVPQVWGEAYRAIPSDLVRSALFTSNSYGEKRVRPTRNRQEIVAMSNMQLLVTGDELNQFDERVYMQLLHYQRRVQLGEPVRFSLREVCDDLGLHPNGRTTRQVRDSIDRLQKNTIDLRVQGRVAERGYSGHLINELDYAHSPNQDSWRVTFSPKIAGLLARGALTKVRHELHTKIGGSLALWLVNYYSSHREPYPEKVTTLKARSGSEIKNDRKFKQSLKAALDELLAVGFLTSWHIDGVQNVHVTRNHAESSS